jgi:hypothetical protein
LRLAKRGVEQVQQVPRYGIGEQQVHGLPEQLEVGERCLSGPSQHVFNQFAMFLANARGSYFGLMAVLAGVVH